MKTFRRLDMNSGDVFGLAMEQFRHHLGRVAMCLIMVVALVGCAEAVQTPPAVSFTTEQPMIEIPALTEGVAMSSVTLPLARDGSGDLTYRLQPEVPGLTFAPFHAGAQRHSNHGRVLFDDLYGRRYRGWHGVSALHHYRPSHPAAADDRPGADDRRRCERHLSRRRAWRRCQRRTDRGRRRGPRRGRIHR